MNKEDLKPFTFYRWKENWTKNGKKVEIEDICFIIDINTTSSPGNYQCNGVEIDNIKSDLVIGHNYNYFCWDDKKIKYIIKEVSLDDINKGLFFDWLFDINSSLFLNLSLERRYKK